MERLSNIASQVAPSNASAVSKLAEKHPDDVVIVAAYRTAHTRGGKGKFKDTTSGEILAGLLKGIVEKSGIDPASIQDIVVGNVCNPGAGVNEHRAAQLYAGIPYTVPFQALNRQCSSGLMAVNDIANKITAGQIDIGIGAGVESMSQNYGPNVLGAQPASFLEHPVASKCLIPMGITSENVAEKYNVSRRAQDEFAANSYQKAAKAQDAGLFKDEILPIETTIVEEDAEGNEKETKVIVDTDEGIRRGVTADSLAKVRPAFKADGSTHAGNASQVSDGAGAVLLMRRSTAEKLGKPILAKYVHAKVVGVPPEIMGIGPAVAIPALLKDLGLTVDDVDVYEINEAFASQALYSVRSAGIDINRVNPKGGAIAFGHPLGATGARQFATLLTELKRTKKKVGVTSMCIGTGMGAASLVIAE
ncbi:acetyl-CoA C-acyltransferase [Sugiyamaella lignohabitans]|uniref:acetyl-CoA C-acyltransferase n=1 Tax=Sugiyamaella lignohabitans TaxID=796027 RepID=A0A167F2S7_9ASCO|nr:acetyl-CoA C-acyltransferase [Sugiyamaella lignohabitans]ANB14753.1 acetyl-CoA C-acyltransferase [Sugiyamaella lignohabitans]